MKIPFRLLFAHLRKNWLRVLLTTGSVWMAVLIFGFLRTFIVGMNTSLNECNDSRIISASAISLFAHLPIRLYPELSKGQPGVNAVTHWTWYGGIYKDSSPEHFWGRFGVDVPTFRKVYGPDLVLDEAVWAKWEQSRQGCIIGKLLADDEQMKVGDRVQLQGNLFSCNLDLEILGVYTSKVRSFDDKTMFFHWDYMNEASKREGGRADVVSTYTMSLDSSDRAAPLARTIDANYESSGNRTKTQPERMFQAQFNSMWGNLPLFFTILGTVVLVACLMVTANTMMLNARERVQEIGVLKTLGFTSSQVAILTLIEGVLVCLVGGALAMFPLRLLDGKMMIFVIASVPWSTVIEGICIALGLGLISGIFPALLATRTDIVTAIRRRA